MKIRIILTLLVLTLVAGINYTLHITAPITAGHAAIGQLDASDASYIQSKVVMDSNNGSSISILFTLIALGFIWIPYAIKSLNKSTVTMLLLLALATPAFAYYDRQDKVEYVEIGMNQSAFLIQEQGDNKAGQAQFMSQDYLTANKVAMKRIQIPHTLLKTGFGSLDMYIPAARLILVDRSPYTREWVANENKGTSTKDESFDFESADSVNISTGITISAVVKEEDAAKFLYNFGSVAAKGDLNDPSVQFTSVIYGKSLAEVMDQNVRGKVQSVLAREFGKLKFTECITKKAEIISIVQQEVTALYAVKGITIEYIGLANSLTFSDAIQKSIDNMVIAKYDADAAVYQAQTLQIKQVQADIKVKEGIAATIQKWNGEVKLPTFLIVSEGFTKWFGDLFGGTAKQAFAPTGTNK